MHGWSFYLKRMILALSVPLHAANAYRIHSQVGSPTLIAVVVVPVEVSK